jgi:hypothetical protein
MTAHSFTREEAHFKSEGEHELDAKRYGQDDQTALLGLKGADSNNATLASF